MNEELTKDLPGRNSFEERVFARFDAADARFDAVDARLEKLESRSHDTKPIWERALKAIMETGLEVGEVKTKVNAIEKRVGVIENKVESIENKVGVIETDGAGMRTDYGGIRSEFEDLKRELVRQLTRRLDLVLKTMVDHRDDLRDAEERITQLETKLA
jgi:chromosome segregation ATPase